MYPFLKQSLVLVSVCCATQLFAAEVRSQPTGKEKQAPVGAKSNPPPSLMAEDSLDMRHASGAREAKTQVTYSAAQVDGNFKPFTGKVTGNAVRMRLTPEADSPVIKECAKGDLVVIMGEKTDFFAVEPPCDLKAYIFRSFVLDNVVEGSRVNIRLAPELNSPVIGFMNTGDRVNGSISEKNHKWLEIAIPKHLRFFVAKEFIEKVGGPELKGVHDKKRDSVVQLMDSSALLGQSEMMKPFQEIDFERISENFHAIIHDYKEFPDYVEKAKTKLMELQEAYLQKKLAYLESKASRIGKEFHAKNELVSFSEETEANPKDRMKIWERVEESIYLAWAASHHQKTMTDFYTEQKKEAVKISGILESYNDLVKHKPGSHLIRDRDMPKAYIYSTVVNLQNYVGRYVTLVAVPRANNNFAFPAYFVFDVEP
ncbi:MAG: hypothetical protein JSR76_00275 [Verrucomicrobia bacterium]|nr:hypothetical protein [Verrucomicrobiota bacterium]